MPVWVIEPHDSLIVRDARPFAATAGARAKSLPFVTPSMVAGTVRGRAGSDGNGVFVHPNPKELLQIPVSGPLLVELGDHQEITQWWLPAPADALILHNDVTHHNDLHRLVPLHAKKGLSNLPADLAPVGLAEPNQQKASNKPYWNWQGLFAPWLLDPKHVPSIANELFLDALPTDLRTHVSINADTGTVGDDEGGHLFTTQGLSFRQGMRRRFGIAVATDGHITHAPAVMCMGGERRLTAWHNTGATLPPIPAGVIDRIVQTKQCRVITLTPAWFAKGWRPDLLLQPQYGVTPTLIAAATSRAQVLSGWDLLSNRPKPSQRFVAAGATYFLSLAGDSNAIVEWVQRVWMQSISDDLQAQRDGFGLAVVGAC